MFTKLLDYKIFTNKLEEISLEKKTIINTINPHSYITAKRDFTFKKSLLNSTFLMPDGIGFVVASMLINKKKIKRVTGFKIHEFLLNKANAHNLKIFYFGASNETLDLIEKKNKLLFPNLKIKYFSPPYKNNFSKSENLSFIDQINQFKPDILFIGMTAPKQEKWVYNNYKQIDCKVFSSIGAVFDFYSGKVKRPSSFFQRIGLEWFIRFLGEPRRLFVRNFISTPLFLKDVFIFFLKSKLT